MTSLLIAFLALKGVLSGHSQPSQDLYIAADRNVSLEQLAVQVQKVGKLDARERGTRDFLVELKPGVPLARAKSFLATIPGVRPLDADEEPYDMRSLKSLTRKVSHLRAEEVRESSGTEPKQDKGDYLQAYQWFVHQRAFPSDQVNWSALARARQHADKMRKASVNDISGIHRSAASNTWTYMGPTNLAIPYQTYYGITPINGRVNAVAYDPTLSTTIYAGGAQGGLWKSTDGGSTWNWLSSTWSQLAVNCITVDPNNHNTIYVGRGDYHGGLPTSYGIMKSTDGGSTWTEIAEGSMGAVGVNKVLIDPTNSQILIAGTGDNSTYSGWLYRSTNGGSTWTKISVGGQYFVWPTIAASAPVGGATRIYAVAAGYATGAAQSTRLYVSDDHGATWSQLASPLTADGNYHFSYEVATSPTNANNVYVLDSENASLYTSSNQGSTWTNVSANLPQGPSIDPNFSQSGYDYHLECGTKGSGVSATDVLYLGEINVMYSLDGGSTWKDFVTNGGSYSNGAVLHNDQHCLAVCPTDPTQCIFSNDGGVYGVQFDTNFTTGTVSRLSKNLGNTMFYHIAMHPTNPNYALGGTQDNASPLSTGDLNNWLNVGAGDGAGAAINQTNPLIQYNSYDYAGIYRTANGWNSKNLIANGSSTFSGTLSFTPTIVLDPSNQNLMYTGTNYLYQWSETTQKWTSSLVNLVGNNGYVIQGIAVAPSDTNRIYVGSNDGVLSMSTNQGSTWTKLNAVSGSLPTAAITSISVSASNPSDILVGLGGTGTGSSHLYRCSNTTAATPTFTAVGGSGGSKLPDVSLNAIARDLTNPTTTWWVANDVGVFVSSDSGSTWSNAGSSLGLPNVIVDDLVAVPGTGYLNAGTYGRGLWHLQIGNVVNPNLSAFTISPLTVTLGSNGTGTVTLSAAAPAGGINVSLSSASTSVATVPSTVTVAAGSTTATFTVTSVGVGSSVITASYNGGSLTQTFNVTALAVGSLSLNPTTLQGGATSVGTITLNGTAATSTNVTVSSNNASATVTSPVTIPAGKNSATFNVNTTAVATVTTATITANLGSSTQTAQLTINPAPITGLSLSPTTVVGGNTSTGTVTLGGAAGPSGAIVTLQSSSANATVPASVTVAAGATTGTFTVNTSAVNSATSATITATLNGTNQTATLTINPITATFVTLNPTSVIGGNTSTGTVTISSAAGASGTVVNLSSSSTSATVPATVTVASGATTATFTVTTAAVGAVTNATITASLNGTSPTASLTINPAALTSVTVSPTSVAGGTSSTGTVTLNGQAPTGGTTVTLSSGSTNATVPANVIVAAGASTATFTISTVPVATNTSAIITGSVNGTNQTATLTITAATLTGISVSPNSVTGGTSSTGTVNLSGPAGTGGAKISIQSSNAAASVPGSVIVPAGSTSATFTITTTPVATASTATITGTLNGANQTATLTVNPPAIQNVVLNPTTVLGGSPSTGTVTLTGPAPSSGMTVLLQSNNGAAVVSSSVSVPSGSTTATFNVTTSAVGSVTSATITGTLNSLTKTATLTINPPSLTGLSLNPTTIVGGSTSTGTVTLNGNAPAGGLVVALSSSDSSTTPPASVTVPAGAASVSFTITTSTVASTVNATITATAPTGSPQTAVLVVQTPLLQGVAVNPSTVAGGANSTGTVTLSRVASSGGTVVTLTSSTADVTVPASVTVAAGATTASFNVTTVGEPSTLTATITASFSGTSKTATLIVQPTLLTSVSITPNVIAGGTTTNGTVTLSGIAPTSGMTVTLTSSSTNMTVPASVTVPVGASSASFQIGTKIVSTATSATLTAKLGLVTQTATLSIQPPTLSGIVVTPTSVIGGSNTPVSGTVGISGPAPSVGATIKLTSSNTKIVTVPASVKVVSGNTTISFAVTHLLVQTAQQVVITATYNGVSQNAILNVGPYTVSSITISPSSVLGGTPASGTVTLGAPAGTKSGAIVVKLTSSSKAITIPATVSVPVGSSSAKFNITTIPQSTDATATVTASLTSGSQRASITVLAAKLKSLSVTPTTVKGSATTAVTGTVTLTGPAPTGGFVIKLTSSDPSATVPATVTVPAGKSSATFKVSHTKVTGQTSVTLTATHGTDTQTAALTVTP